MALPATESIPTTAIVARVAASKWARGSNPDTLSGLVAALASASISARVRRLRFGDSVGVAAGVDGAGVWMTGFPVVCAAAGWGTAPNDTALGGNTTPVCTGAGGGVVGWTGGTCDAGMGGAAGGAGGGGGRGWWVG